MLVSVLRTSTPVCWSSGSHYYMMSSRSWPSMLPCARQLWSYLCWSRYKAPYRGGILYLGLYCCVESCLTYAFMLGLNISSYEAQGPICFCGHILYILVPVQVMTDFQSKVLCMVYCLQTWSCRTYWVWRGFRAQVICRTWHLLWLKCISHVFSHLSSFWRSCCRVWESSLLVAIKYTAVSSAKSLTCKFMFSGRTFMYRRNKFGPRTEPRGTPEVRGSQTIFPLLKPHIVNVWAGML